MGEIKSIDKTGDKEILNRQTEVNEIRPITTMDIGAAKQFIKELFENKQKAMENSLLNNDCENNKNCPIEGNNGHWTGERGNSKWKPDCEKYPPEIKGKTRSNPDQKTWGQILDDYDIDGIEFREGNPDFDEVSKSTVHIEPFSDNRSDNFDKADIEQAKQKGCSPEDVSQWRKENNYTWHECKDQKTMQKVPNEIHANIPHSGGISEAKKEAGE